ncbi:DUF1826 domain-containing protein [Vreelandella aquamarina]|uniref:DUF1826 domain-containing protein n=1 Tax=Vreelandella aquamarina TaxID=77097 RepID=UPI003850424E
MPLIMKGRASRDHLDIVRDASAIERISPGDIALIKGSGWGGHKERGLVHRSPALEASKHLLMTSVPASCVVS